LGNPSVPAIDLTDNAPFPVSWQAEIEAIHQYAGATAGYVLKFSGIMLIRTAGRRSKATPRHHDSCQPTSGISKRAGERVRSARDGGRQA
jgi:hypothetical protein